MARPPNINPEHDRKLLSAAEEIIDLAIDAAGPNAHQINLSFSALPVGSYRVLPRIIDLYQTAGWSRVERSMGICGRFFEDQLVLVA